MVTINLLPWRQYEKAYQTRRIKLIFLLVILLSVTNIVAGYLLVSRQVRQSGLRVAALTDEINRYQMHSRLLRVAVPPVDGSIGNRYGQEFTAARLFAGLGRDQTQDVCFTEIKRNKGTILFVGKTRSAADLTDYLRRWNVGYLFSEITLKLLEQENGLMRFIFQAQENQSSARN
jgi:Tfp pilus assembly protein PilN